MYNYNDLFSLCAIREKMLSFDEIMEVYNDEIEDIEGVEFSAEGVANHNRDVSTERVQCEEEAAKDNWKARHLATEWGKSDDVISLRNGAKFYYFKIPHKVS